MSVSAPLAAIRAQHPLLHCISNIVSANDCANLALAIGASPIMAQAPQEMADIAALASAVVLNTGTPDEAKFTAARTAGAGGGTVIHAKGTGMEGAAAFLGVELVNEKELVLIVSRTSQKNTIMKAIMEGANPKAGTIVFSLPVTDTAGLRLMEEDEAQPEAAL